MLYLQLFHAVVIIHLAFVAFVVLGGLFLFHWNRMVCVHLPALAWGAWVEFSHTICPLTYLENWLRLKAGLAAYPGGFVEHYLIPILYPNGLTATAQIALGTILMLFNAVIYALWLWRLGTLKRKRQHFVQ